MLHLSTALEAQSQSQHLVGNSGRSVLTGPMSWVMLDFGKEVGGLISMKIVSSSQNEPLRLASIEFPAYIRPLLPLR